MLTDGVDAAGLRLDARDRQPLVVGFCDFKAGDLERDQLVERRRQPLAGGVQLKRQFRVFVGEAGVERLGQFQFVDRPAGGGFRACVDDLRGGGHRQEHRAE